MTESYEGTVLLKALLIPGVLGCANMVLLVNGSRRLFERRRQLMLRFLRLAWIVSVPWLVITLADVTFIPHGVAAAAMRDSALIVMFLTHITLSYIAIDAYDSAVARRREVSREAA